MWFVFVSSPHQGHQALLLTSHSWCIAPQTPQGKCSLFVFSSSGEVISNLQDLQNLTVDMTAEKEKQKSEVKHILQQKQRALSELFKMLAGIGVFTH